MEVLEISNSSAIAKISFNSEDNTVGVAYTYKPDKFYVFKCDDLVSVQDQIKVADSVGKLISDFKKDGTLVSISTSV
jgi:hypothetical protein